MKKRSPMQTKGDGILELRTDNTTAGDFWMLTDGETVTICAQKLGESATQLVNVPRSEFNKMIRWYTRPQTVTKWKTTP